jgi:hypothetical protein
MTRISTFWPLTSRAACFVRIIGAVGSIRILLRSPLWTDMSNELERRSLFFLADLAFFRHLRLYSEFPDLADYEAKSIDLRL